MAIPHERQRGKGRSFSNGNAIDVRIRRASVRVQDVTSDTETALEPYFAEVAFDTCLDDRIHHDSRVPSDGESDRDASGMQPADAHLPRSRRRDLLGGELPIRTQGHARIRAPLTSQLADLRTRRLASIVHQLKPDSSEALAKLRQREVEEKFVRGRVDSPRFEDSIPDHERGKDGKKCFQLDRFPEHPRAGAPAFLLRPRRPHQPSFEGQTRFTSRSRRGWFTEDEAAQSWGRGVHVSDQVAQRVRSSGRFVRLDLGADAEHRIRLERHVEPPIVLTVDEPNVVTPPTVAGHVDGDCPPPRRQIRNEIAPLVVERSHSLPPEGAARTVSRLEEDGRAF